MTGILKITIVLWSSKTYSQYFPITILFKKKKKKNKQKKKRKQELSLSWKHKKNQ